MKYWNEYREVPPVAHRGNYESHETVFLNDTSDKVHEFVRMKHANHEYVC